MVKWRSVRSGARETRAGVKRPSVWNGEQITVAVLGVVAFVLGTSVHRDRSNLAVVLVGLGAVLIVVAALLPRMQSISGKAFGVELSFNLLPPTPSVSDGVMVQAGPGQGPPRDLRGAGAPTSGRSGFGEAIKGGPAVFVVINLKDGRAWLSSRLNLFVQVLAEVRGVEAVVFTAGSEGTEKFVGVASVCDVVARFSWAFPWIPEALGQAWDELRQVDPARPPRRRLASEEADDLYNRYVTKLQLWQPPPPAQTQEWQRLTDGMWEHANWIDRALIIEVLGAGLADDFIIASQEQARTIQAAFSSGPARYVAILNEGLEVQTLIDRWKLLDQAVLSGKP